MQPSRPELKPGKVYRTRDLAAWGKNPSRLARRLEREGLLKRLAPGLFVHPRPSSFGPVPPDDDELLRGFLEGSPYVISGPEYWNALALGTTSIFPARLVYNTKRSGDFDLGGRRYILRRVRFPEHPTPEWYAVDLIEHHALAGVSRHDLEAALTRALSAGRFKSDRLQEAAREYGTKKTRMLIARAIGAAERPR